VDMNNQTKSLSLL